MSDLSPLLVWQDLHHSELNTVQMYAILQLRCEVFIVEQNCPYQDIDGLDIVGANRHIIAWLEGKAVACSRILVLNEAASDISIGRVIVSPSARGHKLGYALMQKALISCTTHWPQANIELSAQAHLQHFYASFGFVPITDIYYEDGIAHIGMRRK